MQIYYKQSHHITSHHITSHHITSHPITSHHITSHHITSHHIISHHITSHHITSHPEIDISVSKLLGFETCANFLRVSVSVSENLVSENKSRYRFRKIWYRKKVSVSVSE